VENTKKTKQEKPGTSWTKVIGITALVIVPLMVIGFIILRVRQWKLGRK
jgi:hypothetical protein